MKLKKCVYLDNIGLKPEEYFANYCYKDKVRGNNWKAEQETYGFDSRETWNIDTCLAEWLYTRLKRYQEVTIVNTDACKYNIDGKEVTLTQAIQEIIDGCEFFIINKWDCMYTDTAAYDKMKSALKLLSEVFPSLWW